MADAASSVVAKVTVTAALGGIVGAQFAPLFVAWGGVLWGAAFGAAVCVSFASSMSWGASCRLWMLAFAFGLTTVWAADAAIGALGIAALEDGQEAIRPVCAAALAAHWRKIMTAIPTMGKDLWDRIVKRGAP